MPRRRPGITTVLVVLVAALGIVAWPAHLSSPGSPSVGGPALTPIRPDAGVAPATATSPEYQVNFTEQGLPNGTVWNVTLQGTSDAVVGTVNVGSSGTGVLYDYVNDQVYVALGSLDVVAVLNGTNNTLVGYVAVGGDPVGLAVDPYDGLIYVTNAASNTVSVINGTTDRLQATIPVGKTPMGIAIDTINETLYVADSGVAGRGTVSIINGSSVSAAGTIRVGIEPVGLTYDPWTGMLYVANFGSSNLTVVNASTNRTVGWIPLPSGSEPETPALDNVTGDLYVPNDGPGGGVYVVDPNDTSSLTTIPVGAYAGTALFDSLNNDTYVGLNASREVAIVNTTTNAVAGTFTVPSGVISIAVNNTSSGELYVATGGSSVLTIVNGSYFDGGAATPVPPTTLSNTTALGHGTISFLETPGTYAYTDGAGPDYLAVSPSGTLGVTSGNVTVTLAIGPPRTLSFQESGLGNGASWAVDLRTVVSDGVVGGVRLPSAPAAEVYDPDNGLTFVALPGTDNLTILNGTNAILGSIAVGEGPDGLLFDPVDGYLFVANAGSDNLTVLNGTTDAFVGSVGVGSAPGALALAPVQNEVLVADASGGGAGNVSIVGGRNLTVVATLAVGADPDAVAYDALDGLVYVADAGSANLTVIRPASDTVTGSIALGPGAQPTALAADPGTGELFAALGGTAGKIDIFAPPNATFFAAVRVGDDPDGLCYDPLNGYVYVSNAGSDNLSVLNATDRALVGTIPAGAEPGAIVLDAASANLTVANVGASQLEIVNGSSWHGGSENLSGVTLGSDRVVGGTGTVTFTVLDGNYTFEIIPASGFEASPAYADIAVTGNGTRVPIGFTPIPYSVLTFLEGGLSYGTAWTVVVNGVAHVVTSDELSFQEPAGTYTYALFGPVDERITGLSPTGSVALNGTGGSGPTEAFSFVRGATYRITFHETGLPSGQEWCVTIAAPVCSMNRSLAVAGVSSGIYPYSVPGLAGDTVTATSGGTSIGLAGTLVVSGRSVAVALRFVHPYPVTFEEVGLPAGTTWSVRFAGELQSTDLSTLTFEAPNGSRAYGVPAIPGYTHLGAPRSVRIDGAGVTVTITFSRTRV